MPDTRVMPLYPNARQGSPGRGYMAAGKNIDVGGVRPLVSRAEINCVRPGVPSRTGKPTYKSQEEQYQEIQDLKQGLAHLREENLTLKTKSRRLEEDLVRRDKQIQQLMDPTKNDEARRKLTDKGSSLVTSLKLRVSRLESTLRSKESELAKLQSSIKATTFNEMKIEAETYYQEVVRLRNQLNIMQQQQQQQDNPYPTNQQQQAVSSHPNATKGKRESKDLIQDRRGGGDGQESPSASLRQALNFLEEENSRLVQKLSGLRTEKEKLTADLERVLGVTEEVKGNFEGLSRAELIREVERREAEVLRWENQHKQLTDALGKHSEQVGENSALLQARVSELQGREEEWNRERSSLQELISTLKDDRIYYKETAQKKETELEGLRQEVQALQKELMSLQGGQRRRAERSSSSSVTRTTKSNLASASRSGSSSETHTPSSRSRPRPSSARPPSSTARQRGVKATSEPRETPSPSRHRTLSQKDPRKPPQPRQSTTSTRTSSSRSESSIKKTAPPGSHNGVRQRSQTSSSSLSSKTSTPAHSKTSTPIGSPSKVPRVTSSSSTSSQLSVRSKQPSTTSSPQHKNEVTRSPRVKPGSPVKTPTPRSSSGSSTPSSQARSSPSKVPTPRSPSKVPLPSPRGRKSSIEAVKAKINAPQRPPSSSLSSAEEDERILAELIFQRDSDSSDITVETPRSTPMARQHTVTLDTQEEEEEEERKEGPVSEDVHKEEEEEEEVVKEREVSEARMRRRKNKEISETLDVLRSLLTGHLSRQQEVNHLLTSAPLLVGEAQGTQAQSTKPVPEGAEGGRTPLVRQGTFNVEEEGTEGDGSVTLHATLDAHLTRAKGVRQLK